MRRVGAELSAPERWRDIGPAYAQAIEGAYHRHRLAVIASLLPDLKGRSVVDFGCGEGVLVRRARRAGAAHIVGIDIDQGLLRMAMTAGANELLLGSVEALGKIDRADCIIAANVAAYFTQAQDAEFYAQVRRLLPTGGHLVITHSNELFDLFTFNAFTTAFHRRHFGCDPSALITHPSKPDRATFNVRENPLAYPEKLARHGLAVERVEFMNLHAAPPLLSRDDPDDMQRERPDTLGVPEHERWKLMFQCSMFGVRARAI